MSQEENYRLAVALRDKLLTELNQNETFMAFQHAQVIVSALSRKVVNPPSREIATGSPAEPSKKGTRTTLIVDAAVEFLRRKGSRAPSGEILAALTHAGIKVGGERPGSTLASYLAHSPRFDNVTGQGYGLVEWSEQPQTETPNSGTLFGAPKTNGTSPLSP